MIALLGFIKTVFTYRYVLLSLAVRSFNGRYIGSGGGVLWSILQPLFYVLLYWLVFSVGFKAKGPENIPFVLYFMCAFLPWHFLSQILSGCLVSVLVNQHLSKKIVFPTETLPIVEIAVATISHLILLSFTVILLLLHGYHLGLFATQILYGYICVFFLSLGLGWILAATNVFYRDIGQSLETILNFWFWSTPIVWSIDMIPENWRHLMLFNPMFHIVETYRASLLYNRAAWVELNQLFVFWGIVFAFGLIGATIYRRLKPEFAEVL